MKKIIAILLALLVLVGCGKGYSKLTDGSDVIYSTPDGDYTKNDLYKSLKISSESAVETDIVNKIAELENIDVEAAEEEADEIVSMYEQLNATYYLIYQYGSIEAFKENYVAELVETDLAVAYVNDQFDELVEEDSPVKMQVAFFNDEETAAKVVDEVNAGATFADAIANNGYTDSAPSQIYLDSSSTLDLYIKQYLNETDTVGMSSVITSVSTTTDTDGNYVNKNTYYVCYIDSRNVEDFKEDYISQKSASLDSSDVKSYFFEKHDIKFYDQDIYEMMKEEYEVLQ